MLDRICERFPDGKEHRFLVDLAYPMQGGESYERVTDRPRMPSVGRDAYCKRGSVGRAWHFTCDSTRDAKGTKRARCKRAFMPNAAPTPEEVTALSERAHNSQVRLATDKGDIVFTFFPEDAPVHTAAFMKLAEEGFYDGLAFHRVEPGFVIQGGDPDGDGTGGPGYRLKAEFNERPHVRGTVAMARSSSPDSAGSQFYICLADARFLDKNYTVFGQMTEGFEALDAIRRGDKMNLVTVEEKK